jgi:hypothetical protein
MWDLQRRAWHLRYDRAVALGLTDRVINEPASNTGCPHPRRRPHVNALLAKDDFGGARAKFRPPDMRL